MDDTVSELLCRLKIAAAEIQFTKTATPEFFDPSIQRLQQVHSSNFLRITKLSENRPEADAHWTTERDVKLAVAVADCTALIVAGKRKSGEDFLAAIHAGWRGTSKKIIEKTIADIEIDFSKSSVWLSPSICQQHFEVGAEVLEALGDQSKAFAVASSNQKFLLDLKGLQISILKNLGLSNIWSSSLCTFCQKEFISYRRDGSAESGPLKARHLAIVQFC